MIDKNSDGVADNKCTNQETSTISYIDGYFADYSVDISYEQLTSYFSNFDVFETGVIQKLTSDQIGDMIVQENVYESEEKVTKVFEYLQTQTIEIVDAVMTRFSNTSFSKNIQIENAAAGEKILEYYLNIIKTEITTYTTTDITLLFEIKIRILVKFFCQVTLSWFSVETCDINSAIVEHLNKAFSEMSDSTRTAIANWILSNLKSSKLNGCTSDSTTTTEWVVNTMKDFFQYTTLKDVIQINPQFDVLEVIRWTSLSQKVEYLCDFNALTNRNVTITVLESLGGEDNVISAQEVVTFLTEFNAVYEKLNVKTMTTEVQQDGMTYLFDIYISDDSLTEEQISYFQESFTYFVAGITSESVKKIPNNVNCDSYKSLFGGISSAYDYLSDNVRESVFNQIINYLDFQDSSSSDVCSSLYTDSRSYIQIIFQRFASEATIYEFEKYYSTFDSYSCLDVFTGTQL
ncbi:uncharacterized protein [Pyxicephalus adspersus]|uniref:uncharacterized protein n=1 Tax=Pyxicephalus adspersus TaxID=30357 RepID=UPI003B593C84